MPDTVARESFRCVIQLLGTAECVSRVTDVRNLGSSGGV